MTNKKALNELMSHTINALLLENHKERREYITELYRLKANANIKEMIDYYYRFDKDAIVELAIEIVKIEQYFFCANGVCGNINYLISLGIINSDNIDMFFKELIKDENRYTPNIIIKLIKIFGVDKMPQYEIFKLLLMQNTELSKLVLKDNNKAERLIVNTVNTLIDSDTYKYSYLRSFYSNRELFKLSFVRSSISLYNNGIANYISDDMYKDSVDYLSENKLDKVFYKHLTMKDRFLVYIKSLMGIKEVARMLVYMD